MKFLKNLLRETGADIANSFIGFRIGIVAGQEKRTINGCTLAFAIVRTQNNKIQRVTNTREVILLDLEWRLVIHLSIKEL